MYIYILVLIGSVSANNDRGLWNFWEDLIGATQETYVPEDARLNISQLAKKYRYPLQEHTVQTQDGYILNFHRLNRQKREERSVVFLMHGIVESSDCWMLMGPKKALAYVLADQGFDVWMGNARGNKYSLAHASMNSTQSEFWDFSWEEIALYDLPAMIDYILNRTKQDSLYYVGHSQGTTVGYVLGSMKPEYNSKMKLMFSLAPEAWMGHVQSHLLRFFSPAQNVLELILSDFNTIMTGTDFFNKISGIVCSIMPVNCDNVLYSLSGYETKINETFLSVILGHSPTGSSIRQFSHYGQLVHSERFCRYDYDVVENLRRYESLTPPDYDLSKVTVPVILFYSCKDWLSDPKDVDILKSNLPNVDEEIYLNDFTHLDYLYAEEAVNIIYRKIIELIDKFENVLYVKAIGSRTENTPNSVLAPYGPKKLFKKIYR
ncbi:lipase 3 [Helicoverpa armigera]|uniref:lipase 3 n=1 Tax=Helicoverpa armigera TaxID=29058 RepID=UPI00308271C5